MALVMRRTRMRRVGKKGRAKATRLKAIRPLLEARSGGRCENPLCRTVRRPLDPHHIVKRSQGGSDDPATNLILLCRADHRRLDLPRNDPRHLRIMAFTDGHRRAFAVVQSSTTIQCVPLAVETAAIPPGG